jgi:peptidoglycan-N-acetylglucosamine deacetylase
VSDAFRVALTLDAEHPDRSWCPPDNAERILETLRRAEVRASIFVQGRWALAYPEVARRIPRDGHLVGHHSHFHAEMPLLSDAGLERDLDDGRQAIETTLGVDPRPWFRCPFGAGHDDPRVVAALDDRGYRNVHWHVAVEDWEPWRTGEAIAHDAVAGAVDHGDGAVILLHTWPGGTGEAIGPVVDGLRAAGATFVTIDELEPLP